MTTGAWRHRLVGLLYFLERLVDGRPFFVLAAGLVIDSIINICYGHTLPWLSRGAPSKLAANIVLLEVYRLKLVGLCARGSLLWNQIVVLHGDHGETFLRLFLECFGLFHLQLRDCILVFEI